MYEISQALEELSAKLASICAIIKPAELEMRLKELESKESDPNLWQELELLAQIAKDKAALQGVLEQFALAASLLADTKELMDLGEEEAALLLELEKAKEAVKALEIAQLLSGPDDSKAAIFSIHPGAGGTESSDWALMIYRMYSRFAQREGFSFELLDLQEGDEAGLKSASFIIRGANAYGYLKYESGTHRLVRISPFDSNKRRHTSFCGVLVSPEIDDDIKIEIDEKDIRIDYYRASGAGGQHVNKTESAVRITHKSGVVVQCQNDRSQHKNKARAMKMLRSRLYEAQIAAAQAGKEGPQTGSNSFGHQIRSYVLAPYQQVKDLRSNKAYSQVASILDGDLMELLTDTLSATAAQ